RVGVLAGQPHAPGERVGPAAGDPGVHQRVEHAPFRLAQPGHDRNGQGGEHFVMAGAARPPGDLAAEPLLGLARDLDPLLARLLAESLDSPLGRGLFRLGPAIPAIPSGLGRGQRPDDADLLAIDDDLCGLGEPLIRQPTREPCLYLCTHDYMITLIQTPVNRPSRRPTDMALWPTRTYRAGPWPPGL